MCATSDKETLIIKGESENGETGILQTRIFFDGISFALDAKERGGSFERDCVLFSHTYLF